MAGNETTRHPELTDFPEYAEVSGRLDEFKVRALDLEFEIREIEHLGRESSARSVTARQAEDLLSGGDGGVAVAAKIDVADLDVKRQLLQSHRRAIPIQKKKLQVVTARVSREITESLRPKYSQIMSRLRAAILELAAVADEERIFRENLNDRGIQLTAIYPIVPPGGWGTNSYEIGNPTTADFIIAQIDENYPKLKNGKVAT